MALMKTSNKRMRDVQRFVHLVGGLLLVTYAYGPLLLDLPAFEALVRFVVVSAVVGTGMAMWQLPRLRKRLRGRTRVAAGAEAGSDTGGRSA
jgi:hypothetical protein